MENTHALFIKDDRKEWFLALNGESIGPFSPSEILKRIEEHETSWADFAWRAGFSEWKRLCDLDAFKAAVPAAPKAKPQAGGSTATKPSVRKAAAKPTAAAAAAVKTFRSNRVWFLYLDQTQYGPLSLEEILQLIDLGRVTAGTHVWKDGFPGWVKASEVEELRLGGIPQASRGTGSVRAKKSGPSKSELRTAPRQPLVAKVWISDDEELTLGVCRDISVGGMQVLTDRVPGKVGARIKLNISPAASSKVAPFTAVGVIVRLLEDGRGFSFRFEKLDDRAKRALEKQID